MATLPIDPVQVAYWADLVARHNDAAHGAKGALIDAAMAATGLASRDAVFRRMREFGGFERRRKQRTDAGSMAVTQATLDTIAGVYREGGRADGRRIMTQALATSIVEQSPGHLVPVSTSTIGRYMRAQRKDARSQGLAEHYSELRSLHPNHVHQVDPSLCVLYYMGGKQYLIEAGEYYKNKLERISKIQCKCWRYVLTDHYSGFIVVRYYVQAGESQAAMFEFLMWAWSRCEGRILHALPLILMWDAGSANTAHGLKRVLAALDIDPKAHATGRSNVKGQVETSQLVVERGFESRLRFSPVADVDALNAAADQWSAAYNANRLPARLDSRIRRLGAKPMVRTDLWLHIRADQIRECPARDICARLLEGRTETRVVRGQAVITYPHPAFDHSLKYSLRTLTALHRGDTVEVAPLLLGADGAEGLIRLRYTDPQGQVHTWRVAPELEMDRAGRSLGAAVIGESYCPPTKRAAERAAEGLDALAYPQPAAAVAAEGEAPAVERTATEHARRQRGKHVAPFGGELNALAHLADITHPTYLPRRGEVVAVVAPEDQTPPVPLLRALARLRAAWGRAITREESQWIAARYGAAIPEAELQRLAVVAEGSIQVAAIGGQAS